jgi:predicted alpha-1,2-mannosidase
MNDSLPSLLRWALGAFFLLAGALKIAQPGDFHSDLLAYDLALPDSVLRWIAIAFPWLELFCGGALLAKVWPETTGFLVSTLCLVFVLTLSQAVLRGLDIKCGCFGSATPGWFDQPLAALVRASLMLGVSLWLWLKSTTPQPDRLLPHPPLATALLVMGFVVSMATAADSEVPLANTRHRIAAGEDHSLALRTEGTVASWGYNYNNRITPPESLAQVVAVSAGNKYSLALKADGTVVAWGDNFGGRATPPRGLPRVMAVAAGYSHALALCADGTVTGWGTATDGRTTPPAGLRGVIAIAAGRDHSLALKADGTVVQWGRRFAKEDKVLPAKLNQVVAIAAGNAFSLALKSDGSVVGWGRDFFGQASGASALRDVVAIAAADESALALKADGTVVFFGRGVSPPKSLRDVVAIAAGPEHNLALKADGTVVAWGSKLKGKATPPAGLRVFTPPPTHPASNASSGPAPVEDLVDPFIGTGFDKTDKDLGACMPGPCLPHASIYPSPETLDPSPAGYRPDQAIVGFAQLHTQGTGGNPSYGNFLITPRRGLAINEDEHASSKSNEVAKAYAYSVHLNKDDIDAEVVPGRHSALYRFTFPAADDAHIMVDVSRKIGGALALDEGSVQVDPSTGAISGGGRFSRNWNPAPFKVFFAARVSRPPSSVGTWTDQDIQEGAGQAASRGRPLGAFLRFKTTAKQPILLKIAVSFTSVEQANRWLDAEIPAWDFEGLRATAAATWRKELSAISLPGASPDEQRSFYTALWHSFVQPRDRTGDIAGYDLAKPLWDDHYTLWDTWQTLFPLMSLLRPDMVRDNVNAFIHRHHHNADGYVAEAYIQGSEFKVGQGGNETDNVIGDAYAKGIPGIDWTEAYAVMKHHAENGRTAHYREHGWMASDETHTYSHRIRSGSATLGFAYNDFLTAQVARGLGRVEEADRYLARSRNWRNVWDNSLTSDGFSGFVRARAKNGSFSSTPATQGYGTDFYEGICWEFSFNVSHDVPGMIEKMGGRERFIQRLQHALRSGYIDFSNEPSFRTPWLFDFVGRPYLSSYWADVLRRKYAGGNLPGDDDSGAMSSLYIFLTAGFFPLAGQDLYALHGARVPAIAFHLPSGKTFTVLAQNAGPANPYVQSATLDGAPLDQPWLSHASILSGSTLRFVMGPKPSAWGTGGGFSAATAEIEIAQPPTSP